MIHVWAGDGLRDILNELWLALHQSQHELSVADHVVYYVPAKETEVVARA